MVFRLLCMFSHQPFKIHSQKSSDFTLLRVGRSSVDSAPSCYKFSRGFDSRPMGVYLRSNRSEENGQVLYSLLQS